MKDYKEANTALARLNNEFEVDPVYRDAILSLHLLVMVKFTEDLVVRPNESAHFGYWKTPA